MKTAWGTFPPRFLLKCLDFTSEILQSSDKCDHTLTENHVNHASSDPTWSGTSRTSYVGAVTRIESSLASRGFPVRVAHRRLIWTGYKFINLTFMSCSHYNFVRWNVYNIVLFFHLTFSYLSLQIVFEATVSSEQKGYIGLDDIVLLNYPCCKLCPSTHRNTLSLTFSSLEGGVWPGRPTRNEEQRWPIPLIRVSGYLLLIWIAIIKDNYPLTLCLPFLLFLLTSTSCGWPFVQISLHLSVPAVVVLDLFIFWGKKKEKGLLSLAFVPCVPLLNLLLHSSVNKSESPVSISVLLFFSLLTVPVSSLTCWPTLH